jgi:acyl-CoA reductase-like NAD-dependent aldehyde dehydrogenase
MPLRTAVEGVRAAIAAGDHTSASYLLEDFRRAAECAWKEASPDQRQQVARDVHDLLRWARETVLATRSHQQGKLLHFTRARAYLGAGAARRDCLELDA